MPHSQQGTVGTALPHPFPCFPPVMAEAPYTPAAGAGKSYALASSYLNFSGTLGASTSRDPVQAGSNLQASANALALQSTAGYLDGSVFTRVPPPPTSMVRHSMDATSGPRRLEDSLSFSASASYVPVATPTQQWTHVPPPPPPPARVSPDAAPPPGGSCVYAGVPQGGVLLHTYDAQSGVVWCLPSDCSAAPVPAPQQQQQLDAFVNSFSQSAVAPGSQASAPPGLWSLRASLSASGDVSPPQPEVPGGATPVAEGDCDDYEYEPYSGNTLASRRVGSLDRVRCRVHGKERSAQNMVLVRSKLTNETHWRCKRSSQCKARTLDSDDTPLCSKDSTLRSTVAEALFSPTSEPSASIPTSSLPPNASPLFNRGLPPQYTLASPSNASLANDKVPRSPPFLQEFVQPATHAPVGLPPALAQSQYSGPSAPSFMPMYAQETGQPITMPANGSIVSVNGVAYRVVHVESAPGNLY